jgi:hypothetical protein
MLPFTADILFASFAQQNRELWPAPLLVPLLGLAAVLLTLRPAPGSDRAIGALLAAAWLWTGIGYHLLRFATINFAAPAYGIAFVLEGLMLAWTGAVRGRLPFRFQRNSAGWAGLALAMMALAAWPLADRLVGHGWESIRLVGMAPEPTAAFTLGLLLLTDGRTPWRLIVIPLAWTLVAGVTAWILSIPQDLALPVVGMGTLVLVLRKNRRVRVGRADRA